jgi:hypothetical protein
MLNVVSLMSVEVSSQQSKAEMQAVKNWLSQTCLTILEIFWYLWYLGDWPRDSISRPTSMFYVCGGGGG